MFPELSALVLRFFCIRISTGQEKRYCGTGCCQFRSIFFQDSVHIGCLYPIHISWMDTLPSFGCIPLQTTSFCRQYSFAETIPLQTPFPCRHHPSATDTRPHSYSPCPLPIWKNQRPHKGSRLRQSQAVRFHRPVPHSCSPC